MTSKFPLVSRKWALVAYVRNAFSGRTATVLGGISFALTGSAFCSQGSEDTNLQPVIRITVNLVQMDAVVTDSKGNQITNLRPEDFRIFDNGELQAITNFS